MAKKKSLQKKATKPAGAGNPQSLPPTRADQAKLRQLFKTRTADSLKLAGTLLHSAGAQACDYEKIFTTSFIGDLIKPKRGQSQSETLHTWEWLLAALSPLPATRLALKKAVGDIVSKAGYMSLGDLSTISDTAADFFASHKDELDLHGLTSISDTVAQSLSRHKGYALNLCGLLTLSGEAAEALGRHKGDLDLSGISTLSEAAARGLSHHRGELELDGLVSISGDAAEKLAMQKGSRLSLNGLTALSEAAAKAFAKHKGYLVLGGVTTLSDGAAIALAAHKGRVWLKGLKTLSDAAADALAANTQIELPFKFNTARLFVAAIPTARPGFLERQGASSKPFLDLATIPPGTFTMGSPPGEAGRGIDERQVEVRITKPFSISRTVVTQSQWREVMGSEPWRYEADNFACTLSPETCGDQFPAVWITWDLASLFCKTLTNLERETGQLSSTQAYRLPTEAEWEYACRAGTTTAYSFGDNIRDLRANAWYRDNSSGKLHEVAQKKPNAWGLYDMHGNVWEWCSDWYDSELMGGNDPTGRAEDPGHDINKFVMGPMPSRVIRGGNRFCKAHRCRSAHRGGWGNEGWRRDILVGFRVICS